MDRRNFIKSLLASGILGSGPLAAQAAEKLFKADAARPVLIVGQSGLPHADALVAGLAQVFAAAGINCLRTASSASELKALPYLTAILDRMPGDRVIGVMDDASGMIFQELAAARGAVCSLSTHHRFGGQEVRHCCTAAALDGNIVWSDSLPDHDGRIARLYAGTLGARTTASRAAPVSPDRPYGTPGSLVSFLITA